MKRVFLVVIFIFSLLPSSANAVVMKNLKPIVELAYLNSDQISDLALTPVSIVLVGTTESASSAWINGPLGGLSDGFIAAYTAQGAPLWNLRLGGAANEIASSVGIDIDGSIWVVGASTSLVTPTASSTPTKVLNPDNVALDPAQPINTPLN